MNNLTLKSISVNQLRELADKEHKNLTCTACQKETSKAWSNLTLEVHSNIEPIAEFQDAENDIKNNNYNEFHPNGTNYWSIDAPIAIHFYPYHESKICTCIKCKAVFLTYTEYSGHAPQSRIRYMNKDLIID